MTYRQYGNMYAASTVWNNELLWITGGTSYNETVIQTTEYLDIANSNGDSYPGPNLPIPLYVCT